MDGHTQLQSGRSPIAEFGSLSRQAGEDITILQEFFRNRDRHMAHLFGANVRRNPTRDELLRQIMLQFAEGQQRRMAFYVQACSHLASQPAIRSELELLAHANLVVLLGEPGYRRARLVAPTRRLVNFYNTQMGNLRTEVLILLGLLHPVENLGVG